MSYRTLMRSKEQFDEVAILRALNTVTSDAVYDKLMIVGQIMGELEPVFGVLVVESRPTHPNVENNVFAIRYDFSLKYLRELEATGKAMDVVSVVS